MRPAGPDTRRSVVVPGNQSCRCLWALWISRAFLRAISQPTCLTPASHGWLFPARDSHFALPGWQAWEGPDNVGCRTQLVVFVVKEKVGGFWRGFGWYPVSQVPKTQVQRTSGFGYTRDPVYGPGNSTWGPFFLVTRVYPGHLGSYRQSWPSPHQWPARHMRFKRRFADQFEVQSPRLSGEPARIHGPRMLSAIFMVLIAALAALIALAALLGIRVQVVVMSCQEPRG